MVDILYFVAFILCIVVVAQVFRVYELILELKGGGSKDVVVTEGENKTMAWFYVIYLFMFFGMYAWCYVNYSEYFLPEAASVHGAVIDELLDFNFLMINSVFFITSTRQGNISIQFEGRIPVIKVFILLGRTCPERIDT